MSLKFVGSKTFIKSKQWKSNYAQDTFSMSQNKFIKKLIYNDSNMTKQINSSENEKQDMIALACKELRGVLRRDFSDLKRLKVVCKIFMILSCNSFIKCNGFQHQR